MADVPEPESPKHTTGREVKRGRGVTRMPTDESLSPPVLESAEGGPDAGWCSASLWCPEAGKQSKNTLLDIFERYIEMYMILFDAIWSV